MGRFPGQHEGFIYDMARGEQRGIPFDAQTQDSELSESEREATRRALQAVSDSLVTPEPTPWERRRAEIAAQAAANLGEIATQATEVDIQTTEDPNASMYGYLEELRLSDPSQAQSRSPRLSRMDGWVGRRQRRWPNA